MTDLNERGITINRALAWILLVSVTGLIWWGGGSLASLQGAADRLTLALTETREMIEPNAPVPPSWKPAFARWKPVPQGRTRALMRCPFPSTN